MKKTISARQIKIALQWMHDEIGLREAANLLGMKVQQESNALPRMAVYIREAYRRGIIASAARS